MSVGQGDGFRCALPILRMTRVGKGIANNSRLRLNTRTPPPAPASRPRWRTPRAAAGSVEPEPPPSPPSQASHEVPDARCLHLAWVRPRVAHSTKTPMAHLKRRKTALPNTKSPQLLPAATLLTRLPLGVPARPEAH